MSRQSRLEWFASRASSPAARRSSLRPHRRPLRFEPLEDRRLLALTVTTLVDENDGINVGDVSLREAIAAASPGETIDFSVTGTITLEHGELVIDKDLTIDGPGADLLTVQVQNLGRAFFVDDGNSESRADVAVRGITITGGFEPNGGGAVFSREKLEVADCLITGNTAQWGGGIYNDVNGELTVVNSEISGNTATSTGGGGGIYNWGGLAFVFDSVISGNDSGTSGGGLLNANNGSLTISRSTVADNDAVTLGGGLFNGDGNILVVDSTFSGNTADYGGAIYVATPTNDATTIRNSTISNNIAPMGGAGVFTNSGRTIIQLSTVSDNNSNDFAGSGVVTWGDSSFALTEIYSSIVAGNHHTDVAVFGGFVDTFESQGYNLIGTGSTAAFGDPGDLVIGADDPGLGPLAGNGGPTKTHALLYGSIAIDAGDDTFTPPPDHDQRGAPFARVSDGRMDIGALEAEVTYFLVDTLLDEDDGIGAGAGTSLRDALAAANFIDVNAAVITFDPELTESGPGTMLLSYGQLNVEANVTIAGPGADRLTIDAQGDSRVILVDDFDSESLRAVTIRGLTLTGGVHADEGGGGIFSNERLALRDSVLTGNEARWGGGLYNHTDGELTVVRSTLSGNSAVFGGAGVYNWGGDVEIRETTVSGNDAADAGGVLNANFGEMLIEASTINGNHATGGSGGGILQAGGLLTIRNSTISSNEADNEGGGIQHAFGPLEIYHTTITANRADADQSGLGFGGGIFHVLGPTLLVDHTIVAGNFRQASTRDDVAGSFDARFSLFGDATGASINDIEGNLIGTEPLPINPLLDPFLADNGGPTLTHALLTDSPAIDAGDPDFNPPPDFDQRGVGFDRESGGQVDIGAFEVQTAVVPPALLGDYNRDNSVDAADYTIWRNTLGNDVELLYDGADGDGDGKVDDDDYRVWKMHFGESIEIGGSAAGSFELAGSVSLDGQILVTTLADTVNVNDGVTSLREAIFAANIVSGPNTIEFDPALTSEQPGTILLTQGELAITDSLIIAGPGAARLTIDASGNDFDRDTFGNGTRIFNIDDQNSDVTIDVEIRDLRLTGGDIAESGGAIVARENFSGVRLVVEGNHAFQGGAISLIVMTGMSSIVDSDLRDNSASAGGGAVEFVGGSLGAAILSGNAIRGNSAKMGGAIFVSQSNPNATLLIDGNLIAENSAIQQGGAIALMSGAVAKTTIRSTTISGNTAGTLGGGIFLNLARDVTIIDSTIADNRSLASSFTQARGGGIYASGAEFNITASTISGNQASSGGGIFSRNGEVTINFSTLADNDALSGSGGGLYSLNDRLALFGSTITGNTAGGTTTNQGRGGGIWHAPSFVATSTIADTTISDNQASLDGGGLYFRPISETAASNFLTLENLTITGNTALRGGGVATAPSSAGSQSPGVLILNGGSVSGNTALTIGGGIYARIANLTVNDTTISGNRARTNGGGIAGSQFGGTLSQVSLHRVLVHQNIAGATIDGQLSSGEGGGLWFVNSASVLSINQSQVTENVARRGAGIFRVASGPQGNLVLNGSTVSGNVAENQGGGLYNQGGLVAINVSTIANNVASIRTSTGGGIFNRNGDLTVSQSTISGNTAPEGRGGGIYHANGDLTVKLSTISGNFARQEGGGVWALTSSSDRITFHSSTISGNSAQFQTGALSLRGQTTIRHSTITKNFVTGTSAGPAVSIVDAGQAEIDHSIIAGNTIMSGVTADLLANNLPLANVRYSIIGNNQGTPLLPEAPLGSPDANGNLIGRPVEAGGNGVIDPLLAPLADNGGPTLTHAILPDSPALDGGAVVSGPPLGFDQRGNPISRMVDGTGDGVVRIDVGAYESQGVPSFSPGDFNRDGLVDIGDYTFWRQTLDSIVEPFTDCDASGDGCIGPEDYAIWKSHFGDGIQLNAGGGSVDAFAMLAEEPVAVADQPNSLFMLTESNSARTPVSTYSSRGIAAADLPSDALVAWLADRSRTPLSAEEAAETLELMGEETALDASSPAFDAVFTLLGE